MTAWPNHLVEDCGHDTPCWTWQGTTNPKGYGSLRVEGRMQKAHRFAYELLVGPIPDGLYLDHLCRNRACVNPAHLEPVTNAENCRRGSKAVLTAEIVRGLRAEFAKSPHGPWAFGVRVGPRYGVSAKQIYDIVRGTRWVGEAA